MNNGFLERPKIVQDLPDRKTINNLIGASANEDQSGWTKQSPSSVLPGIPVSTAVSGVKEMVEESVLLLEGIRKTTRGLTAVCRTALDADLAAALSIQEVADILSTGQITYAQLQNLRGTPFFEEVQSAWQNYHEGMDGSLEAELEPICESILQTFCNFSVALSESTLYNIPWNGSLDLLSDLEIQTRQELIENQQQQLKACANSDIGSYNSLKEQADLLEATIRHRNDLSGTIHGMVQRYRDLVSEIRDVITAEARSASLLANQTAITSFLDSSGLPIPTVKLLLYESFNGKRAQLKALKNGPGQSVTAPAKAGITRDLVRKTRVHLDMSLPVRSRLVRRSFLSDSGATAAYDVLQGVETAQENYRAAMSTFLGMANTEVEVLKKQLSLIYDKDKTRTMYKR